MQNAADATHMQGALDISLQIQAVIKFWTSQTFEIFCHVIHKSKQIFNLTWAIQHIEDK